MKMSFSNVPIINMVFQIVNIDDGDESVSKMKYSLEYDPEWLAVLQKTDCINKPGSFQTTLPKARNRLVDQRSDFFFLSFFFICMTFSSHFVTNYLFYIYYKIALKLWKTVTRDLF